MAFDRKYELLTCESNSTDDDCEHDTFSQVGSFTARQQVSQWGIPIRMLSIFNGMLLVLNLLLMSIASGKIWSSSTRPGTLLPGYQTDYRQSQSSSNMNKKLTFTIVGIQGQVQVETRAFVNQLRPNESSKEWEISFDENTPRYTGIPNAEIDRSWHNLLAGMNFNTTLEDAPFLRNRTYNFPDGQHLVGLEVYHALHCLVSLSSITSSITQPGKERFVLS